ILSRVLLDTIKCSSYKANMDENEDENYINDEIYMKNVEIAQQDLLNYPENLIRIIGENMKIQNYKIMDISNLAKEIAKKLIFIHMKDIPLTGSSNTCYRYSKKIDHDTIEKYRKEIYDELIKYKNDVSTMTENDLEKLFKKYDMLWFN